MSIGLVGRKSGMTRVFTEEGLSIPVTVVEVQPNRVTQVKTVAAQEDPDPDANATAERIRKKYPAVRDQLEERAADALTARDALGDTRFQIPEIPLDGSAPFSEVMAPLRRVERARETNERIKIDPQFARHVDRCGIRPAFVSLKCLEEVWSSFSPKRRLSR